MKNEELGESNVECFFHFSVSFGFAEAILHSSFFIFLYSTFSKYSHIKSI